MCCLLVEEEFCFWEWMETDLVHCTSMVGSELHLGSVFFIWSQLQQSGSCQKSELELVVLICSLWLYFSRTWWPQPANLQSSALLAEFQSWCCTGQCSIKEHIVLSWQPTLFLFFWLSRAAYICKWMLRHFYFQNSLPHRAIMGLCESDLFNEPISKKILMIPL